MSDMAGRVVLCASLAWLAADSSAQTSFTLRSPDSRIEVRVRAADRIEYDVLVGDRVVLERSSLSMTVGEQTLGVKPAVTAATPRSHDQVVEPPVRQKAATLRDQYNELRLDVTGGYAVVFRAYDHGVAYRFETNLPGDVVVRGETAGFRFATDHIVFYPEEQGFFSHNERHFLPRALADLAPHNLASIPAVVDAGVVKVAITDADVDDYPGLWLRGTGEARLEAAFPPVAVEEARRNDRDVPVTRSADYIAKTTGTRPYPWRVLGIARRDADLITNPLVYLLAKPSQIADTSWIEAGKVAWDWWNANNLGGVAFEAGINTDTYKHYIDFAARYGLKYVILDEGWYVLGNVMQVVPAIDMEALAAHARQRNVGLILWVVWKSLDDQLTAALDRFEQWGIKGLKIDFMQRDDQAVVNFYHRVTREAAQRRMLVDYHGGIRPALMTRTWPNLITTEGVRGMEWSKWSAHAHPEHDVTLPFTRMFVGPMDYTPGAMVNAARGAFAPLSSTPMSQGTRCHQLAMYVVFESPLQMLADSPSSYEREPDAMAWLSAVPTVWDETRVLDARLADYVVVARRSGADWYIGAMTDWTARELEVDLSFLPAGAFTMESWEDGVNAGRRGEDTRRRSQPVTTATKLKVKLAEGGGWAARIAPAR
jgi:alpha-glucosidase